MLDLIVLGLVQGLTEFLPVSSTAHLLFVEHYLGIRRPGLVLEAVLHLGTAAAAIVLFWPDIVRLLRAIPLLVRPSHVRTTQTGDRRMLLAVLWASAVTGVLGLAFAGPLERMFESVRGTAMQLMITGVILMVGRQRGNRVADSARTQDGLAIGVAQALAIIPGISRSATTIVAGLSLGFRRVDAARLSFLVAIPAILGAAAFALKDAGSAVSFGFSPLALVVGALVAAVSGAGAIVWLLDVVRRGRLAWFAAYCWVAAIAVLLTAR